MVILPGVSVDCINTGALPHSTMRGLAMILSPSPIIRPSPSTVNNILSFARRFTLPLSSVISATTTIKSLPSAIRSLPSLSAYSLIFVERLDGIFFSVATTLPSFMPSASKDTRCQLRWR